MKSFGEPWGVAGNCIFDKDGNYIAGVYCLKDGLASRIVDSFNALQGLNPEAIPELVKVCKLVVCFYPAERGSLPTHALYDAAFAALAKATIRERGSLPTHALYDAAFAALAKLEEK